MASKFGFKKFATGGLGYEEDPEPGYQSELKQSSSKRSEAKKEPARKVDSSKPTYGGPSARRGTRTATTMVSAKRGQELPSDRATGFRSQVKDTGMTAEERKDLVKSGAIAAGMMIPASRALRSLDKAYDAAKAAKAAQAAEDKAGEAARKGLSRRGMPSESERFRARKKAQEQRAAKKEGREPRAVPTWRGDLDPGDRPGPGQSYWNNEVFKKGGVVRGKKSKKSYFSNY